MLGHLEQKIMNVLWGSQIPLKPAQVKFALKCDLAYTTVMTVLKRLADKGYLNRDKMGKVFLYSPKVAKNEYVSNDLNNLFENIINSYGHLAISQFVDSVSLKRSDLELLNNYLQKKRK